MCVFCIDKVNEILLAHYYVLKGSKEEDCVCLYVCPSGCLDRGKKIRECNIKTEENIYFFCLESYKNLIQSSPYKARRSCRRLHSHCCCSYESK